MRFDAVVDYALPSPQVSEHVMRTRRSFLDTARVLRHMLDLER